MIFVYKNNFSLGKIFTLIIDFDYYVQRRQYLLLIFIFIKLFYLDYGILE